MAKWRAIHKSISTSGQVIRLSIFGQLLFERMIIHADDWGIITGDPLELKAKTMPTVEDDLEKFSQCVDEMQELGLVLRYEPEKWNPLIWILKFDDYQPAAVIGKRTDPKRPLHPDDTRFIEKERKGTKGEEDDVLEQTRAEQNRKEKNRQEQTRAEQGGAAASEQSDYIINLKRGLLKQMEINNPARKEFAEDPRVTTEGITSLFEDICKRPGIVDVRAVFVSEMREEPR